MASVYHRPAETFIGIGRLGAAEVERKANEREDLSRDRAIATVVQGQHAENLLDFDEPEAVGIYPSIVHRLGLSGNYEASTGPSAVARPLGTTGLDDLLGLFDSTSIAHDVTGDVKAHHQPAGLKEDELFGGLL